MQVGPLAQVLAAFGQGDEKTVKWATAALDIVDQERSAVAQDQAAGVLARFQAGIFDCLVVGIPDERFGSRVAAVVSARGDTRLDLATVQEEARNHVAGYKVPRELHVVDEVPRAPSGKPATSTAARAGNG